MDRILNLATYYLLPLVELSKSSFGDAGDTELKTRELRITTESNFINTYLSEQNMIVVMVKDFTKVPHETYATHYYFTDFQVQDKEEGLVTLILFRVDAPYMEDVLKFRTGKYSRMREVAKDRIVMFNNWDDLVNKMDNPLYGTLYRSPKLRKQLEENFEIRLTEEDEVKSLPRESNFLDLSKEYIELTLIPEQHGSRNRNGH